MRYRIGFLAAVGVLAVSAQELPHGVNVPGWLNAQTPSVEIPQSLRTEHEVIHSALEEATKAPGRVGAAAKELAAVLDPHFKRENEIALPPLGLLAPLAAGERPAGMEAALAMTDALRKELPRMLERAQADPRRH
jgi:hypothetical protein